MRQAIRIFDNTVDQWFERLRGKKPADLTFYVASEAADYSILWHVINVALLASRPRRRKEALRLALALGAESIIVNGIIKRIFKRERPALQPDRAYEVRRPQTKSFPSGHASSAALASVLLSASTPRAKRIWVILATIVAFSRVHNRMHHGSDVAAGAVIGTAMGHATKRIWPI